MSISMLIYSKCSVMRARTIRNIFYIAESLCCPHETITTLLIGYIPIQNNKFKKIKDLPVKSARQDRNRNENLQRFLGMQVLGKWEDTFTTESIHLP